MTIVQTVVVIYRWWVSAANSGWGGYKSYDGGGDDGAVVDLSNCWLKLKIIIKRERNKF